MGRLDDLLGRGLRAERRTSRLLSLATDLLGTVSADGGFGDLNDAWERELGYSRPELRALRLMRLTHPDDRARLAEHFEIALAGQAIGEFESRLLARDGTIVWVRWLWEQANEGPGRHFLYVRGYVVTQRRRLERERELLISELSSQARADPLTGIPNRRWLRDELAREVARGHRRGTPFCVAMVELDDPQVNAGSIASDDALIEAVDAWRDVLRAVDFLAHFEDGQFAVVLPDSTLDQATIVAERLHERVPAGRSCSIGLAEWELGLGGDDLVTRAVEALDSARAGGGNRIVSVA
jgi:diguanylate cyclase (GGDEF)-like protein/PAS domain S-box-containing protein